MSFIKSLFPLPGNTLYPGSPCDPVGNWVSKKIADKIVEVFFEDTSKNLSKLNDDDVRLISQIIEDGRKQELEELNINISKDLGTKFEASGTLPFEVPINVSAHLKRTSNGEYCIKVKYLPMDQIDRIAKLKELHAKGALTDQEFSYAKKKIIEKI